MNAHEFVSGLRLAAHQIATKSIMQGLEKPPGREPELRLVRLARWFEELGTQDREMLADIVALTSEQTTYNVLLVLDGLLAIESAEEKGRLELFYVEESGRTRLNDPDGEELSALFKRDDD